MQKDLEIRDPEYKSIIAFINSVSSLTRQRSRIQVYHCMHQLILKRHQCCCRSLLLRSLCSCRSLRAQAEGPASQGALEGNKQHLTCQDIDFVLTVADFFVNTLPCYMLYSLWSYTIVVPTPPARVLLPCCEPIDRHTPEQQTFSDVLSWSFRLGRYKNRNCCSCSC